MDAVEQFRHTTRSSGFQPKTVYASVGGFSIHKARLGPCGLPCGDVSGENGVSKRLGDGQENETPQDACQRRVVCL